MTNEYHILQKEGNSVKIPWNKKHISFLEATQIVCSVKVKIIFGK